MKKIFSIIILFLLLVINTITHTNAAYVQSSATQESTVLGSDDVLTATNQNNVILDISRIIVDLGGLKDYVDSSLSSIWTNESTQISYNAKDVYFKNNLQVIDTIKANGLIIPAGGFKDGTITTDEIVNGEIKQNDLAPEIFNSLTTLFKLNGTVGYYNQGNVGINTSVPSEKLSINGNLKFITPNTGIIFPDGTIQTSGNIDTSNNVKLTGDQVINGVKKFTNPIILPHGQIKGISNDITFGKLGTYCSSEGQNCAFQGDKRVYFGAGDKFVEGVYTNGVNCNTTVLGDPATGVTNSCYIAEVGEDLLPSKYIVKKYIDTQLTSGIMPSCGTDDGTILDNLKVTTTTHTNTTVVNNVVEDYNYPNWATSWTYSHGGPNYSDGSMYVSAQDHGGGKKYSQIMGTFNGTDYVGKIEDNYRGSIDTSDCRGSGDNSKFETDGGDYISIGNNNSGQSGRSRSCNGNCNNKNFGGNTGNWSCLSDSCGSGRRMYIGLKQGNLKWAYIYRINGYGSGEYDFENKIDFQAKTWHIVMKNTSGTTLIDKIVNLPPPSNGLLIDKFQGIYHYYEGIGKTCGRGIYHQGHKATMEETHIVTTSTDSYKFLGNNKTCNVGTSSAIQCLYDDGTKGNCVAGTVIPQKIKETYWNCSAGKNDSTCGAYTLRPDLAIQKIVNDGTTRKYSDGTVAKSCLEYLNPTNTKYPYKGDTGDGTYTINPGSGNVNVYCDMTTDGGGWTLIYTDKNQSGRNRNTATGMGNYWTYGPTNTNIPKSAYVLLAKNSTAPFRFYTNSTGDYSYFIKMNNPSSVTDADYWSYLTKDGLNITNYSIWMGKGYSTSCGGYQVASDWKYTGSGCSDKGSFDHSRAISYGDMFDFCSTSKGDLREGTDSNNNIHYMGYPTSTCSSVGPTESGGNLWSMWIK